VLFQPIPSWKIISFNVEIEFESYLHGIAVRDAKQLAQMVYSDVDVTLLYSDVDVTLLMEELTWRDSRYCNRSVMMFGSSLK